MGIAQATVQPKRGHGTRLAVAVIAGSAAMLLLADIAASVGLPRISRIERRTSQELTLATRFRHRPGGPRKLLVVGNSLLLEGVQFSSLARGLGTEIEVCRVVVEQTSYLDWYYGIRTLFAEGAAPDVVVLELSAAQLLSNGIRGDYSANRLFQSRELLPVARDAGYSPTQAASLWFAHYSGFYGARAEIRKWLLSNLMPSFQHLQPHLARVRQPLLTRDQVLAGAPARLRALQQLAAEHGATFILLAPATLGNDVATATLVESGLVASVEVLAPLAVNEAPPGEFSDGFHLNAAGAERYTAALAPLLRRTVMGASPLSENIQ